MMCELQGDTTREDTTLHAAIDRLDYPGRVSSGENPQGEEVAPSTTCPTKVVAPKGIVVIGSNRCWPRLSPNAAIFTRAHHPKAATSTMNTEEYHKRQPPAPAPRGEGGEEGDAHMQILAAAAWAWRPGSAELREQDPTTSHGMVPTEKASSSSDVLRR
jgi:hypothetical protein